LIFSDLELHPTLLANLAAQSITVPTPIQEQAIPLALSGGNVVGLAQTGTGKTAAFVLPILQRLMGTPRGGVRALIVTPTRELAEQVNETVIALARGTGLRTAAIYGGVGFERQERALREGIDVVVACPGRLLDLMGRGAARLDRVQVLVLDEADRMLDMGFLPSIRRIIAALPQRRQTMLFSATLSEDLTELAESTAPAAARVQIGLVRPAHTVTHAIYPVSPEKKTDALLELLYAAQQGSVLVFTRTKHRANRLMQHVAKAGFSTAALHSNKSQNQRQAALDGFRDGRVRVLVATDIAARGIDVDRISHVINYDIPDTPDAYIHRIGRTGRAERTGDAFTLVTPEDAPLVRQIERAVGSSLERRQIAGFDLVELPTSGPSSPPARQGRPQQGRPQQGRPQQGRPQQGRPQQGRPAIAAAPRSGDRQRRSA
jgi:ATP-dependent RNA helicase RhlE